MRVRESAIYLGYIAVFAAVVAWGFLWHAPRDDGFGHARSVKEMSGDPIMPPHLRANDSQLRRLAGSMVK
jgi:hypothetical protein